MVKKNDGIKESTDSSTTIEDEDSRGMFISMFSLVQPWFSLSALMSQSHETHYVSYLYRV